MIKKEIHIINDNDHIGIFNYDTDKYKDFCELENKAFLYLKGEFPIEVRKNIIIYNQLSENVVYFIGREGLLTIKFYDYSIFLLATINAAKILGIDFKLLNMNDSCKKIYIR